MQTINYRLQLSDRVELVVWFLTERSHVLNYAVTLLALHENRWHTVRVYDNRHGRNEMHRHTLAGGKQPAETFHAGDFGEAMRSARTELLAGYDMMIEAWQR